MRRGRAKDKERRRQRSNKRLARRTLATRKKKKKNRKEIKLKKIEESHTEGRVKEKEKFSKGEGRRLSDRC